MKKNLQSVSKDEAAKIWAQFPELQAIKENEPSSMSRVAISIFDHWLRDENEWHLMDCFSGAEREQRDKKFREHWSMIFDVTPVYTLRYRGRWQKKAKLVLKRFSEKRFFIERSLTRMNKSPSQFVVLPELHCIYVASWDDTNVLYYADRATVEPILKFAGDVGLHCLEYEI